MCVMCQSPDCLGRCAGAECAGRGLDAHLTYMYVCYRHIHARMLLTHVRTHTYTSSSYGPAFHSNVCSSVVMFVLPLIPRSGQDMMPLWACPEEEDTCAPYRVI